MIEFRRALQGGTLAGLRYLNARTPHRFTGIFKYEGETLVNLLLVDREHAHAAPWANFSVSDSFCSVIRETGQPFILGNASVDARVANHPARDKIISYCGVPLLAVSGELFASLCHFDYKPILFSALDIDFVMHAAPLLLESLLDELTP